ncbi:diaminopimelate decarboxylase [Streptacidiphilus sp. N1-12]|uniref:Diaminopimelate decarboxylase n=2 Tax=Streptacidiphilus alkalitolerans TaxID=3342712 RepID=A0ABV6WAQ8_9ACTN
MEGTSTFPLPSTTDHVRYTDGVLTLDGLALDGLVADVGTPAYVYSLDVMAAAMERARAAFAPLGGQVSYSVKVNSNQAVLARMVRLGAGFDVVSGGELSRVLAVGGDPARTTFAGVGKTDEELALAVRHDVLVNIESADECEALNRVAAALGRRVRCGIRVNPGVTVDTLAPMQTGSAKAKFGLPATEARALLDACLAGRYPQLSLLGVHMHVGSQVPEPSGMVRAAEVLLDLLEYAQQRGLDEFRRFDLGGGFPIDYGGPAVPTVEEFAAALTPLLGGRRDLDVYLEPGRSIAGPAGVLVAQVLYRKHRPGQRMLVLDTGMHHLIRPALYRTDVHRILPVLAGPSAGPTVVVGPVCESTDTFAESAELPDLAPGDLVAFMDAGAYGMVMASHYNTNRKPPEIVVENGAARVARPREQWSSLFASERP